jgi:hypothetical protein
MSASATMDERRRDSAPNRELDSRLSDYLSKEETQQSESA